jgi:hypothetical protein
MDRSFADVRPAIKSALPEKVGLRPKWRLSGEWCYNRNEPEPGWWVNGQGVCETEGGDCPSALARSVR